MKDQAAAIPKKKTLTTTDITICSLFVALVVIGAYIKIMIPIGPFAVTFSLQFLFSLMAGLLTGPKRGGFILAAYLLLGLVGLPVFAHGGGIGYILRPTFGFLIGFLGAAIVSGAVKRRQKKNTFMSFLIAAFLGELIYYLCGLIYYYIFFNYVITDGGGTIGIYELLTVWCFSTFLPDFGLVLLASFLSHRLYPHMPQSMIAGRSRNQTAESTADSITEPTSESAAESTTPSDAGSNE